MEAIVTALSLIATLGFGVAAVLALTRVPISEPMRLRTPLLVLSCAMAIYVFVGISNTLEHGGITSQLDEYEDYIQVLFAPLVAFSAFAAASNQHLDEQQRSSHLLARQNELLVEIIDTSPVGIMIVAPGGAIIFANDPARSMLGVAEDSATGQLMPGSWTMKSAEGRPATLADLVRAEGVAGERRIISWHTGKRLQCMFKATPMADASDSLGGAVVTVEAVA